MPGSTRHTPTDVNVADQTAAADALNMDFLGHALLHDRHPGFLRGDVDQYFFAHILF